MTAQFILDSSRHSQFTYKVGLMLRLAREAFEFRYVSFRKGMRRTSEFGALSKLARCEFRNTATSFCSRQSVRWMSKSMTRKDLP